MGQGYGENESRFWGGWMLHLVMFGFVAPFDNDGNGLACYPGGESPKVKNMSA